MVSDNNISADVFGANNHPFIKDKETTTVVTLMLAELAPLVLNHTILQEAERLEEYREQPEETDQPLPVSTHSSDPSLIPLDSVMKILHAQEPTLIELLRYFEEQSERS